MIPFIGIKFHRLIVYLHRAMSDLSQASQNSIKRFMKPRLRIYQSFSKKGKYRKFQRCHLHISGKVSWQIKYLIQKLSHCARLVSVYIILPVCIRISVVDTVLANCTNERDSASKTLSSLNYSKCAAECE